MVNVLDCVKLVQNPTLYASFLLWLLSELFETMPEVGDLEKPKLVFFFDEAHMLFRDAPAVLVQKIEQTVKLIRSRGIGAVSYTHLLRRLRKTRDQRADRLPPLRRKLRKHAEHRQNVPLLRRRTAAGQAPISHRSIPPFVL